jgi:HSP20 family protein
MESSDRKFFEELASKSLDEENNLDVDLVKAGGSVASRSRTLSKKSTSEKIEIDTEPEGQLTIDVYQTPLEIVIESAVAGVSPDDLDINATTDSVTIRGRRHREKEVRDEDYFYRECYWGRFSRSVILPQEVDPDSASVEFKNGILTIRLPKLNRKKTKKLKVKGG